MAQKLEFYERYGVEEYYLYDPDSNDLSGWLRRDGRLRVIDPIDNWVSPRLGVRFLSGPYLLQILFPNGRPFLDSVEMNARLEHAEQEALVERQRAAQAEQEALAERQRAERLAAQLRALGIDPEV